MQLKFITPTLVPLILTRERALAQNHAQRISIYIARLSLLGTTAVFNELEAGYLPLTAGCEWLINQTALLSRPSSPHLLSLTLRQISV